MLTLLVFWLELALLTLLALLVLAVLLLLLVLLVLMLEWTLREIQTKQAKESSIGQQAVQHCQDPASASTARQK